MGFCGGEGMKVIIAGSRSVTESQHISRAMCWTHLDISQIEEVVSGAARGADRLGEDWAKDRGISVHLFPAEKNGKAAGYIRNRQMAKYADVLVAVWDEESKGTKHMIDLMEAENKPVYVYRLYPVSRGF